MPLSPRAARTAALALLLTAGCVDAGEEATFASGCGVLDDPALQAAATPLAEAARIGSVEADADAAFGFIADVAVDGAGRVYVADPTAAQILVFDAAGGLLRRIGRRGEGPGEFQAPIEMAVGSGDTLRVFDNALWRVASFDSAGTVGDILQLQPDAQMGQIPSASR